MSDESEDPRRSGLAYLLEYGWTKEQAEEFLDDEVVYPVIKVPGPRLREVVAAACQIGVPIGQVTLGFIVPKGRLDEFYKALEVEAGKGGGFLLSQSQNAGIVDPGKVVN